MAIFPSNWRKNTKVRPIVITNYSELLWLWCWNFKSNIKYPNWSHTDKLFGLSWQNQQHSDGKHNFVLFIHFWLVSLLVCVRYSCSWRVWTWKRSKRTLPIDLRTQSKICGKRTETIAVLFMPGRELWTESRRFFSSEFWFEILLTSWKMRADPLSGPFKITWWIPPNKNPSICFWWEVVLGRTNLTNSPISFLPHSSKVQTNIICFVKLAPKFSIPFILWLVQF